MVKTLNDLKKVVKKHGWEWYEPRKTSHGGFKNIHNGRKVVVSLHGSTTTSKTKLDRVIINQMLKQMDLRELTIKK